MELMDEILINKGIECNCGKVIDAESYIALKKIKEIIENVDLSDKACFDRIEQIVRVFEKLGSNGGSRHDFG